MAEFCAKHPDRTTTGPCKSCGKFTCILCMMDVDGSIFCSLSCFTMQTLNTNSRTLREPLAPPGAAPAAPPSEPDGKIAAGLGLDAPAGRPGPAAPAPDASVVPA